MSEDRFIAVAADELPKVFEAIRFLGVRCRPTTASRLLILALANLDAETGRILLSRVELAQALRCDPAAVSVALTSLEKLGVIRRERVPAPGRRGTVGRVYLNPALAWAGDLHARARWQQGFEPLGGRRLRRQDR